MKSRRVHAMLATLPAIALAAGAVGLGGLLIESVRESRGTSRVVLIALFAWPMAVTAISFLARAVRGLRDSGRPNPVRTLAISPVGGAWRIPVRRRHPMSTACLAVGGAGGLMAALTATGVLATPALWHIALSVAGSLLIGIVALAVARVLDRDGRASMVLDPGSRVLILPHTRHRRHVVRIPLDRVHAVTTESYGPLGLLNRVHIEFDDELLGDGVRETLIEGVDPGHAMDLVVWIRGFAASRPTPSAAHAPAEPMAPAMPAAAPQAVSGASAAHPAVATAPAAAAPPQPAGHHPAPPPRATLGAPARPRRHASIAASLGRVNMPAALSGLGLVCVLAFVALGVRVQPRTSSAAPVERVQARVNLLGTSADGSAVHVSDVDADWVWSIDVGAGSGVSDQQTKVVHRLQQRFGDRVRFRVVVVASDRGGEVPDESTITRYARRFNIPPASVLVRPDPGVPVPRHRFIASDGRVVHEGNGFMSAGSIERQIGLLKAAARMESRP